MERKEDALGREGGRSLIPLKQRVFSAAAAAGLVGAVFFSTVEPVRAGDAPSREKALLAGPFASKNRGWVRIMKPWRPWRVDYERYRYKAFYPSVVEGQWYWYGRDVSPEGPLPWMSPKDKDSFYKRRSVPPVQALELMQFRFFHVPEEEAKRGHHFRVSVMRGTYCETFDWRGYELLRIDANFPEDAHVWWAIEDRFVQPPVVGNYDVNGKAWVTLEIDLEKAAKERGLELERMWRMWMRADTNKSCQFKNLRLARRGTRSAHPVLRDSKATTLPEPPPAQKPPVPDLKPDLRPLPSPKTLVYRSDVPVTLGDRKSTSGLVSVYDARHVLLVFGEAFKVFEREEYGKKRTLTQWERVVAQTLDGGKTWTGLDGDKKSYTHSIYGLQQCEMDATGGVILHNENGCGNNPGPRHRVAVVSFLGRKGWTFNRNDYIFDEDNRHCSHYHVDRFIDYVRIPSGRIWAAFKVEGRNYPDFIAIHAKYSENEGKNWHTWKEGRSGRIPATAAMHAMAPKIIPYGDHVAVFWKKPEKPYNGRWTYFDGEKWSPGKDLPFRVYSVTNPGKKDVLVENGGGVMRLAGNQWVQELSVRHGAGEFCLSGRSVFAFKSTGKGVEVRRRTPRGKWEGPALHQTAPIKKLYVPKFCPPPLGAAAYMTQDDEKSIKILLVPNRDMKAR